MRRTWAPFLAIEFATVLAGVANGISMVAFPWLVLEVTGSAAAAGTIAAITALPMILTSFFSGTVVDRMGRRFTSVVADVLSLLSVSLVPVAAALGQLNILVLGLVAVLGAVFDPAGVTSREAMLPGAARAAQLPLERVNGIHEASWNVAYVIGPGVGGVLIGVVGAITTFWATAVAFALSALAVAVTPIPDSGRPAAQEVGLMEATKEGIRFLWNDRLMRALAIFYTALIAAWMPVQAIVLPVWFQAQDKPEALGTVLLMMSLGAIAGALSYAVWGARVARRRRLFTTSALLMSLPMLLLATLPPLWAIIMIAAASGFFWGPVNPMVNLVIQRRTPARMLGRIMGLLGGVAFAAAPAGYALAGWLYEAVGPAVTFGVFGMLLVAASLALLAVPALRELDALPVRHPDSGQP